MAAGPASTIAPEFISSVRAKLSSSVARHYINGQWLDSQTGETFETLDPSTNQVLSRAARGRAGDVDAAARAAARAFDGWRRLAPKARRAHLQRIAALIEKHGDELATVECLDAGQVIRVIRAQIARAAENFTFYADYAERAMDGRTYPVGQDWLNYTIRVPVGPCGIITPWNSPLMLSTWRVAPALAAGNTVVLKPAEWSPLTAWKLAQIVEEADLPPGVFNVVQGLGEEAGAALVAHPLVPLIALTGESSTGTVVTKNAADHLKRVSLELGGKSPSVIFADADLDRALDGTIFQIFSLNGERCTANSRVLIEAPIFDQFVARLKERTEAVVVGHPLDPATEVGPLIHAEHCGRVLDYLEIGRREGAVVVAGGHRVGTEGNYVAPTLFTGVNQMRIAQEEIFGPVLVAIPFKDEAEALALANGVKYGLAAYVWTKDVARAHRLAFGLESGMTWINSHNVRHLPTPFGGVKASGAHREGGEYAFEFYTEVKNVAVPLGNHPIPQFGKTS